VPFIYRQISPFAASLMLHLGAFALMGVVAMKPSILAPLGVYKKGGAVLVEFEMNTPQAVSVAKPVSRSVLSDDGDVSVQKKKIKDIPQQAAAAPAASTQLGHADGTATSGLLGDPNGKQNSIKDRYLYELHVLIEGRKTYPMTSRRLRETGKVLVQFTVDKDGTIRDVSVKQGTTYSRLNDAARELIAGIRKYKPLPEEFVGANAKLEIPIEYTLN
jgi:TonB family protein